MNNLSLRSVYICTAAICAVFFTVLGFYSCKKEKADQLNTSVNTPTVDIDRIWNCHSAENPYPSQISANIEGTWVWQSNRCYGSNDTTLSANKHVVVIFNDGGLYKIFEDSKLVSEGTWGLTNTGGNDWVITTSSANSYLKGYVLLCKNELVFSSSYVDGCDYYFIRS